MAVVAGALVLHVLLRTSGAPAGLASAVHLLAIGVAAGVCLARAALVRTERVPWLLIGVGLLSWIGGFGTYDYWIAQLDPPPYPSVADAFWLAFYPPVYLALILMLRARVAEFHRGIVLDGFLGAFALGAVGAAFVFDAILDASGGSPQAVAVALAYPVCDLLLLGLAVLLVVLRGWRLEGAITPLAVALALQAVVDSAYVYQVAVGSYDEGSLLFEGWLVVALLLAWAAWRRPSPEAPARSARAEIVMPVAFTLAAVGVLVYSSLAETSGVAAVLAALAVAVAALRLVVAVRESHFLGQLASQDSLTGLFNHREFHAVLERELLRAERDRSSLSIAFFDLDGFKGVNDARGHSEGDRVLRHVSARIRAGCRRGSDSACRVGGDEFAAILPGTDGAAAVRVAERIRADVIALDEGVGLSYGVATWPEDGPSKDLLVLRADVALYAAKEGMRAGQGLPASIERDRVLVERERRQLQEYAQDLRASYARELERSQELRESHLAIVRTLAAAVEAKDEYTGGHIERVQRLALLLAQKVVPDEATDPQLTYGFLLHDIGKLAVPDDVLLKPGRLTDEEWQLVRCHPEVGARILAHVPFLDRALEVVRHHHERWEGGGYPDGLAGEQIPLWARIFAVADTVDAMTSDRPYRRARTLADAIDEVERNAGTQFDPACVEALRAVDPREIEAVLRYRPPSLVLGGDPGRHLHPAGVR